MASVGGQAVTTATGLAFASVRLPDPQRPCRHRRAARRRRCPGSASRSPNSSAGSKASPAPPAASSPSARATFLAAEAGLLDGHRATTHWAFAERLAREFPAIDVDPDPIFIRSSETVWTAAGVTAGIDLALSLVEDDHGTEVAQTVARWLVLYLRRPGGQTQFAAPVWMPRAKRTSVREVQEAIETEPGGSHSIDDLARRAAMSPRHFTRVFTDEVGEAPGHYVERVRTEAARRQLEETDDTVVAIAARCGFGTAETMRRNFIRRVGISPDQYRKAFA